jgi:two-component sensor histidine kinase
LILDDHQADIDIIASITAVPSILEVVCRTTGMGFAAIARVTEGRWIACSTLDTIGFGLVSGGELPVDTTICHEIRQDPQPVIIEDVAVDERYRGHPTPAMYGFKSYISFPIILSDGVFFGTLCAIDPEPRRLKTPETLGTFKLFSELIAFHIESARKLAESQRLLEERREADRRQRVLQRELAHRMKNTLAMVQAVVTQSLRNASSLEEAAHVAGERIQALGRAQDMLTETNWETADIREVVAAAIRPHIDGGERLQVSGPPAELTAQQGMGLALAIHELATNAAKYGALSNQEGRISVAWALDADGAFRFDWVETGGPEVSAPARRGFGSRLTERVVPTYFQGKAALIYGPGGIEYGLSGMLVAPNGGE